MIGINRMGARALIRGIRTKGAASTQVQSGLELAHLPEQQFQRWSEQVLDQSLPLKTFLSQHRPLMNVLPVQELPNNAKDSRDVMFVHTRQPKSLIFHERATGPIPHQIAQDLGPFSISKSQQQQQPFDIIPGSTGMPRNVRESVGVLAQFLEKYNRDRPSLVHMNLHDGSRPFVEIEGFDEVEATSVRRKRKLKMNRHKYRKRLKEQRTLKRRLGK